MDHRDHVRLLREGVRGGGTTWADLGSGEGAFTLALAELLGPTGRIHTVDRDGRALQVQVRALRDAFPDVLVTPLVADFTTPLTLPPLDGIVMANSLHFERDKLAVLRFLRGYLRPAGRLAALLAVTLGACNAAPAAQPTPQIIYVTPAPVAEAASAAPTPTATPAPTPTAAPVPTPTPDPQADLEKAVAFADLMRSQQSQIDAAITRLNDDYANQLQPAVEIKRLKAVLAGAGLTKGLHDPRPVVVGAAKDPVGLIVAQLTDLGVDTTKLGGQAGKNVATALKH